MVQIDASYYPHIMDEVLRCALPSSPQAVRRVCRYWPALVDVQEAYHITLDVGLPPACWPAAQDPSAASGGSDARAEGPDGDGDVSMRSATPLDAPPSRPAHNDSYAWRFSAARLPIVYLFRAPSGAEAPVLPWADVRRCARILDIHAAGQWVRDGVPLDGFALHTVRIGRGAGWDAVHLAAHAHRVVFADGPYARNLAAVPRTAAACTCSRAHTRKVVLNVRSPVLDALDGRTPTMPQGLRELVVIFHGWQVIPAYDPALGADGGLPGDPRNDARGLIVAAAAAGVHVTVVNVELKDLRRGTWTCNWESYEEELTEFCAMDVEDMGLNTGDVMQRVHFVSTEKYRRRVGEEQFRLETMIDVA